MYIVYLNLYLFLLLLFMGFLLYFGIMLLLFCCCLNVGFIWEFILDVFLLVEMIFENVLKI